MLEISQNWQENTCARVSLLIKLQAGLQLYLKRDSGTGVSCEFCEISNNTFSYRTPLCDCFCLLCSQKKTFSTLQKQIFLHEKNVLILHAWTSKNLCKWDLVAQYGKFRSSCPEMFCKKGVLKNFAEFAGKSLCWSLFFNKVAGFRSAT